MGNDLQRRNRCGDHHIIKSCFCFPWKRIRKVSRDQKEKKGKTLSPSKDNGTQSYTGEVCYILVNHTALGRKPSGNSSEEEEVTGELYENISCEARRPRESLGGTETEYSLLRVSSPPSHPPCPEDEYELLMPGRVSSSLQQPGPRVTPFETQFSHFQ
ncbi:germinal center-associated signaling and motility protein isoform X2 [Cavia porcellus]|uniref:Germinal center associated signaling and motility n=1 Tax=Cavia porcellus TaxID=10141 RepID=A0A286XGX1_CAVPO|nr:germinal center-associated signaling and motility protein isoform X2 [Cavia porcellus]